MYILDKGAFGSFDPSKTCEFVDFWSNYYKDKETKILGTDVKIDYIEELNLKGDLSEENTRRLLRWKDYQRLSHQIMSGDSLGEENPKVQNILKVLDDINKFRNNNLNEDTLLKIMSNIFKTGNVYTGFVFHIAKPYCYPIIDQHVMRVHSLHTGLVDNLDWPSYKEYQKYFGEIAHSAGISLKKENIKPLKKIDNALMAFGQFLNSYHKS